MKVVREPPLSWLGIHFVCQAKGCGAVVEFERADLQDTVRLHRAPRETLTGEYRARARCPHCAKNAIFVGRREE